MSQRELSESVADAIAAGEVVDWHGVEDAAAKTRDAELILQLKIIAAIGAIRRARAARDPTRWGRTLEAGVAIVLTVALAQLVLALAGTSAALARVTLPNVAHVVVFGVFSVAGVALLASGGRDRRIPLLGGLFLTISSSFAAPLMPQSGGLGSTLGAVLRPFQPEAFLSLMLWRFVREFPVATQPPRVRRIASAFVAVSFWVGTVLFVTNAVSQFRDPTMPTWLSTFFELVDRNHPEGVYWPLLSAVAAPAIPFLLWKTRLETYEDRRRVMLFVGALGGGLTPFAVAVAATPFFPQLQDPLVQHRIGIFSTGRSRRLCRSPPTPSLWTA